MGRAGERVSGRRATLVPVALATAVLTCGAGVWARASLAPGCPGFDDEGMVRAPASVAGRVVCSDGGYGEPRLWILAVAALVLWLVAETVWLTARRAVWVLPAIVLVVAGPLVTAAAVSVLPADCTSAQREKYGASGCERDVELR